MWHRVASRCNASQLPPFVVVFLVDLHSARLCSGNPSNVYHRSGSRPNLIFHSDTCTSFPHFYRGQKVQTLTSITIPHHTIWGGVLPPSAEASSGPNDLIFRPYLPLSHLHFKMEQDILNLFKLCMHWWLHDVLPKFSAVQSLPFWEHPCQYTAPLKTDGKKTC